MKDVTVIARFPEEQYSKKGEPMLEITGSGRGGSLVTAVTRAVRSVIESPVMRHKSPKYIYLSIGIDGFHPIEFWHFSPKQEAENRRAK